MASPDTNGSKKGKRPSFEMGADARLLYQRLRTVSVGDMIPYKALSEVVSRKVTGSFGPLTTARKACQREHNLVFGAVRGEGLHAMTDEDKVRDADNVASRIRKTARRGIDRLGRVNNYANLQRELQNKHNSAISIFSIVSNVTTNSSLRKIEEVVDKARKELPMTETLRALGLAT